MKGILRSLFTWHIDTILIAEPDHVLRRLEYRALSPKYRIVQTSNVEEAVRTAARHATEIDLLLTEVRHAQGSGWDLMDLLKLDYPGLKVIYTSSSINAEIRTHTRRHLVFLLENPFRPDRLQRAVRDVLETRQNHRVATKYAAHSWYRDALAANGGPQKHLVERQLDNLPNFGTTQLRTPVPGMYNSDHGPTRVAEKAVTAFPNALLSGTISADPSDVTPLWSDVLTGRSLEEVLLAETENRAWSKTLRHRVTSLMNSRLAKAISFEEYAVVRRQGNEDAAECKRRRTILDDEIRSRDRRWLPQSNLEMNVSPNTAKL